MFMFADPAVERLAGDLITGKVLAGVLIAADVDHVGDSGPSGRKWTALTAVERQWPCAPGWTLVRLNVEEGTLMVSDILSGGHAHGKNKGGKIESVTKRMEKLL